MCELRGEGASRRGRGREKERWSERNAEEAGRGVWGCMVRHAGMQACDAWPRGHQLGLPIALSCQAAATRHPYCIYLPVETTTTAGRPPGVLLPPRAASASACMPARALHRLAAPLPPAPARVWPLATGEKKKKEKRLLCYSATGQFEATTRAS